ncbi:MAG: PAS domain S-box protein [Methylococcaceae bacterium]|nr:PAS domain S-box protein [Methylococcaceae bacterium]
MSMNNTNMLRDELREKAEANLSITQTEALNFSADAVQKLVHEFQVYQIELEMQNEQLRAAQLQLQVSRDRYQTLYDCAPIGFLTLNKEGNITDANLAACALLTYSKSELYGKKYLKYVYSEDQDRFYLFFQQLLKFTGKKTIEIRVKRDDESFISVLCQGYYYYEGHAQRDNNEFFLTLQDVTEQKRAEQKIQQLNEQLTHEVSEQNIQLFRKNKQLLDNIKEINLSKAELLEREAKLNSVFSAAVEGIITIDEAGIIQSVNSAVINIFGYSLDELIGHNVNKLMPTPYKERHGCYLTNYLSDHQDKIVGSIRELEGQHKKGNIIPIDLSLSKYKVGEKSYFTGMMRDISERKHKELLDKQHLDELAHVTRLGLMGEMASGIAHEVNQPLTAIATYSQVCQRLLESDPPDLIKLQEILQKTEQQSLRAGQVISRMREFISSNTIHRSTVDINELVQDAISLANDDCQQFSIQCRVELTKSLPFISADAVQIEQVILNLIKNSIDALTKIAQETPRNLTIQTYLLGSKSIELRVKDNGLGIDETEKARVFTPFFTTKVSGMGMGLSICQSLIVAHGGELRFKSCVGKGSTFYFTLPIIGQHNETQ